MVTGGCFENVKDYFENILNSLKIEAFGGR